MVMLEKQSVLILSWRLIKLFRPVHPVQRSLEWGTPTLKGNLTHNIKIKMIFKKREVGNYRFRGSVPWRRMFELSSDLDMRSHNS